MFVNAHTHHLYSEGISVVNIYPSDQVPVLSEHQILSCGIHPWHIKDMDMEEAFDQLKHLCEKGLIKIIGECGLDKYIEDIPRQEIVFRQHIVLSEQYELPLIIHSVKSHHLILNIRKETKAQQPWIIHGFNGSLEMAEQLIKQNIFLSLGPNFFRNAEKASRLLNRIDLSFVLFETDDTDEEIKDIYSKAKDVLRISTEELEIKIMLNLKRILRDGWIG